MAEVIIAACGGAAVGGAFSVLTWMLNRRAAKADRHTGIAAGVQVLLYDRIKHLAKHHIAVGAISANDLEDLVRMHDIYHDELDGNGYLDGLMTCVKKLPIK